MRRILHRAGEGTAPSFVLRTPSRPRRGGEGSRWVILAVVLLFGCSFFSRSKPQFYSLEPMPGTVVAASGVRAGIGSVELPPGFDRREIVVRQRNHKLEVRESQMWSATLGKLVLHTLAVDLSRRLPEGMSVLPGEAKPAVIRTIDVAFEELGAGPDHTAVLDAHWVIHEPGRADVVHHDRFEVPLASLDSAEVASGTSRALATLADRIAAGLP